ncbi:hypothetical protein [Taibaiella chishuiensis]|nr:hypothetical protein [Taibaiella chishuiensis]
MKTRIKVSIASAIFFMQSCVASNSTTPQTSKDIDEARKNGTFVAEVYVAGNRLDSIEVETAWIEKVWFKESSGEKTITDNCKLCFKIRQKAGGKFLLNDVFDWDMRETSTNRYIGVEIKKNLLGQSGTYIYELDGCRVPDSLTFHLNLKSEDSSIKVDDLTFKRK